MFTKLLVGLDGSPQSHVALAQAISIAKRFRSTLLIAHVTRRELAGAAAVRSLGAPWTERRREPPSDPAEQLETAAQQLLEEASGAVRRAGLAAETHLLRGDVVGELLQLAHAADALFVGRVGLRHADDPVGPDTRALIQRAPTPVVVCGGMLSPMDRCAVAYDGRPGSVRALALAARYAEVSGAQIEVLHATNDEARGREVLARASMALSETPLRFEARLLRGDLEQVLGEALARLECNALFAGAHREEGTSQLPSHTEAILRATDIPVVVHDEPLELSARLASTHRRPSS